MREFVINAADAFVPLRSRIDHRSLRFLLAFSIPLYFVALFLHQDLQLLERLEVPLLSASTLYLLAAVDSLRKDVHRAHRGRVPLRTYDNAAAFFREASAKVAQAKRRVDTTFLPNGSAREGGPALHSYFDMCREWAAREPESRWFRRVIIRPDRPTLDAWLAEEAGRLTDNYSARVSVTDGPEGSMCLAIIDDDYVFVAFAADEERFRGFSVHSPDLVEVFSSHHDRLWQSATPLDQFVRDNDRTRPPLSLAGTA